MSIYRVSKTCFHFNISVYVKFFRSDGFSISKFNLHLYTAQMCLYSKHNVITELRLSVLSKMCIHSCI